MLQSSTEYKNILIVITGSIACYKTCTIISRLKQLGHNIKVVMSQASLSFIGTATIEGLTGLAPITNMYQTGHAMEHINLDRWADLILVAPATANYINKITYGIGDDLLTTLFLAHDFNKPYLIAPAMNTKMYLHPITQSSIQKLKNMQIKILETASGVLACGEIGSGKLLDPELIILEVQKYLSETINIKNTDEKIINTYFKKNKILITSGGTTEPIDDVRHITNKSTGLTGAHIADTFIELGFDVTYLHAKSAALPKLICFKNSFTTFIELDSQITNLIQNNHYDYIFHLAAVSDYSIKPATGKIPSGSENITLNLFRNPKIINKIKTLAPNSKLIAFKLTSTSDELVITEKVSELFKNSNCDFVVQNDWANIQNNKSIFRFYDNDLNYTMFDSLQNLSAHFFQQILKDQDKL